jgi:hypothetical protein
LKQNNHAALALAISVNIALFLAVVRGGGIVETASWQTLLPQLAKLWPAGLATLLVGVLNSQLPPQAKASIIFMRRNNPLPGSRAFTHWLHEDPRIDVSRLLRRVGRVPDDPKEQNALWYRLYQSVKDDHAVQSIHQDYLFSRDYACLVLLLSPVLLSFAAGYSKSIWPVVLIAALLAVQFALAVGSARQRGTRLVTTVLAIASAKEK